MDLALPIKIENMTPMGMDYKINHSLEMALKSFLKAEKLEGDNKYEC